MYKMFDVELCLGILQEIEDTEEQIRNANDRIKGIEKLHNNLFATTLKDMKDLHRGLAQQFSYLDYTTEKFSKLKRNGSITEPLLDLLNTFNNVVNGLKDQAKQLNMDIDTHEGRNQIEEVRKERNALKEHATALKERFIEAFWCSAPMLRTVYQHIVDVELILVPEYTRDMLIHCFGISDEHAGLLVSKAYAYAGVDGAITAGFTLTKTDATVARETTEDDFEASMNIGATTSYNAKNEINSRRGTYIESSGSMQVYVYGELEYSACQPAVYQVRDNYYELEEDTCIRYNAKVPASFEAIFDIDKDLTSISVDTQATDINLCTPYLHITYDDVDIDHLLGLMDAVTGDIPSDMLEEIISRHISGEEEQKRIETDVEEYVKANADFEITV